MDTRRGRPGDLDLVVYSLRKWVRLARCKAELIEKYGFDAKYAMHPVGAGPRQGVGKNTVRLGVQGVELLETGRITLPIPAPWLGWLRDLRQGKHSKEEALAAADELEARLEKLSLSSPLPERPDYAKANAWLIKAYSQAWGDPPFRVSGVHKAN